MAQKCAGWEARKLRHPGPALTLPTSQGVSQWQDLSPHPAPAAQADQEEVEEGWERGPGVAQWPLLGVLRTGVKGWALTTAP